MGGGRVARTTATIALAVAVLSAGSSTALATPQAPGGLEVTRAGGDYRFRFTFDNGETLKPGTRVRDVTRHRHYGVVRVSGRGRLTVENGIVGKAAGYPGRCRRCGRAIIEIADGRGLEAMRHPFSFGAAVRATARQAKPGKDPNIVQKGNVAQPGGQWKLELVGARPRCVFAGGKGTVKVMSSAPVDDGDWHRVICKRVGKVHTVRVDGVVRDSATAPTGRIANSAPIRVGGKAISTDSDNDQYHGDLDNVFLRVDRTG